MDEDGVDAAIGMQMNSGSKSVAKLMIMIKQHLTVP